jgi:hypothetical protein
MRHFCSLFAAVFLFPVIAAAQGPVGAGAGSGPTPRSRTSAYSAKDFTEWQVAIGYQYDRINLLGTPFNTNGLNIGVTRFFGRWFGLDGQVGIGLGGNTRNSSSPPNLDAHSVFVGGGPRLAFRGRSRFEPWVHVVVGLQDFRFTQTAGLLGSNNAFGGEGGGGLDYALGPRLAVRVEAEFLETHFFSTYQRSFQAVTGLVYNF